LRIARPMLLITTPLGLIEGVYECYKLAGGLVVIMLSMLLVMSCALATVVVAIRREELGRGAATPAGRAKES
jgi:hypothetical protein